MEEPSLKEKIDTIFDSLQELQPKPKVKPIKLPRKAKVKKGKLKKGWLGVLTVDENRNIMPEKVQIDGSAFSEKSNHYHATDGSEILFWQGKFPIIIQPKWKLNPLVIRKDREANETYGHPYIKAKMIKDAIIMKAKAGAWIIWILVIGAVIFGVNYLMKK